MTLPRVRRSRFARNAPIAQPGTAALVALSAAVLAALGTPAAGAAASAGADFDGDGHADLAVGAPQDSVTGHNRAGAVNVLYGGPRGPRSGPGRIWHQGSRGVPGAVGPDAFGDALGRGAPGN